jgi:nucleoside-diphosphate-sugar epimerase
VYNVAGEGARTLVEVLEILEDALDARIDPVHTPPRAGDVRDSLADLTAAKRDLGYEPAVGLRDGLRLTAESFTSRLAPRPEERVSE